MTTKTTPAASTEAPALTLRSIPQRGERTDLGALLDLVRSAELPESQAALIAALASHKSALSTSSRLRRKHTDLEFFADGVEVLARPKSTALAVVVESWR
jgi:hypothetical protein